MNGLFAIIEPIAMLLADLVIQFNAVAITESDELDVIGDMNQSLLGVFD
jgi:hypothetical protein